MCEFKACSVRLPTLTLGAMYFYSDRRLRQYAQLFEPGDNQTISEVSRYLYALLNVNVDRNGDGVLTKYEFIDALHDKGVGFSIGPDNTKLWCKDSNSLMEHCYEESGNTTAPISSAIIDTEVLFQDALRNFVHSSEHNFGEFNLFLKIL